MKKVNKGLNFHACMENQDFCELGHGAARRHEEENGGAQNVRWTFVMRRPERSEEDMCLALDKKYKEKEIMGAIKVLRSLGTSESDIKVKIIEMFDVTTEYVTDLLSPQKA